MKTKPIVWSIAGADCSGGAGIAADIKTAQSLKVELCHLITANTVQNSKSLVSVNPTDVEILKQQVATLITDKQPDIIKIGLIASSEQLTWLCTLLPDIKNQYTKVNVVFDPVGSASVGGKFSNITANDLIKILPLVDVITPNIIEAQQLTGINTSDTDQLAQAICALGVKYAIVKGGHQIGKSAQDVAFDSTLNLFYRVTSARIDSSFSHGGGCSFSSAISAFLAHGYLLRDALAQAKAFMQQGFAKNGDFNEYYGAFEQTHWPQDKQFFPAIDADIHRKYPTLSAFADIGTTRGEQKLGLYPVVDSIEWLETLMPLGIEIIQLRVKNKSQAELDNLIEKAVALAKNYHTRLFINDYWQLAIKHGAYGVHIGQEDLLDADLHAIQQAGLRLGISTHGCYEFLLAQQLKPSYLAMGAIFPTKTKDMTGQIQGIDNLKQVLNLSEDIPVVAIGGINEERAPDVWATGTDSIAVVTAITEASNPSEAVKRFQRLLF
ncbi:thiamine phosphate synthase [Thalassotalea marina]|uniref:Thiamine-phosphate synthase n=1 Tax=Thalassotalea marina TaxID=1673741 RepID=A0A919EJW6_9GAMM|nr:thiamine phosphate synthase [Thalassotalea marina]GHF89533.1 bifunctional hydroxymethylpyrimidine kinase/phosphomethylpyrimidine kinase [Thalassotalea marina]